MSKFENNFENVENAIDQQQKDLAKSKSCPMAEERSWQREIENQKHNFENVETYNRKIPLTCRGKLKLQVVEKC